MPFAAPKEEREEASGATRAPTSRLWQAKCSKERGIQRLGCIIGAPLATDTVDMVSLNRQIGLAGGVQLGVFPLCTAQHSTPQEAVGVGR